MLAEGSTFAAYEVRRQLAVGGMGEVYLCRHRMLDRLDAVKVLRPHLATDAAFRGRFLREALSAARLRHPNVVTIYTADEWGGRLYLAMEYVAGEDLSALLRREGRLPAARTARLTRVVADALDTAHAAQLVHRDVKPSNLIVTAAAAGAEESVTLVDFGISRVLDSDTEITRTGEIVGTLAYCAPEQLTRQKVGGACDQYALACVAYECLTGQAPYRREGQLAMMTAHLTAPPPRVSEEFPDVPGGVDAVISRGLAKDPGARYETCADFAAALSKAVSAHSIQDHPEFPGPENLARSVRSGRGLVRPPAHADTLALRLGWPAGAAAGPLVAPLMAGPCAVRGESAATAACVRWLVMQAVARHRDRDLCLVAAVAPTADDNWLWLNWLPHARPTTGPVSGPHVATTPEAAADLLARLAALVSTRRAHASGQLPRVVAVLDSRLGALPGQVEQVELADAGRFGIHAVHLLSPGTPTPPAVSTLDLTADLSACRWSRVGFPLVEGIPDAVSAAYARELADLLPES